MSRRSSPTAARASRSMVAATERPSRWLLPATALAVLLPMLGAACAGIPLGLWLVSVLPARLFGQVIGVAVIAIVTFVLAATLSMELLVL